MSKMIEYDFILFPSSPRRVSHPGNLAASSRASCAACASAAKSFELLGQTGMTEETKKCSKIVGQKNEKVVPYPYVPLTLVNSRPYWFAGMTILFRTRNCTNWNLLTQNGRSKGLFRVGRQSTVSHQPV